MTNWIITQDHWDSDTNSYLQLFLDSAETKEDAECLLSFYEARYPEESFNNTPQTFFSVKDHESFLANAKGQSKEELLK